MNDLHGRTLNSQIGGHSLPLSVTPPALRLVYLFLPSVVSVIGGGGKRDISNAQLIPPRGVVVGLYVHAVQLYYIVQRLQFSVGVVKCSAHLSSFRFVGLAG